MATQQYDVWSVSPKADADFYVVSVTPSGAGALGLVANTPGINGYGYKVSITSVADETTKNFTITGIPVGSTQSVTEVVAGGNNTTVYSTNYFATVTSITVSAATAGAITVGYGGALALPRCRIKGVYYVGASNAGSISISDANSSPLPPRLFMDTPGSVTTSSSLYMAAEGILVGQAQYGYAIVTLDQVTKVTLICG
jgi:hypothetical protein